MQPQGTLTGGIICNCISYRSSERQHLSSIKLLINSMTASAEQSSSSTVLSASRPTKLLNILRMFLFWLCDVYVSWFVFVLAWFCVFLLFLKTFTSKRDGRRSFYCRCEVHIRLLWKISHTVTLQSVWSIPCTGFSATWTEICGDWMWLKRILLGRSVRTLQITNAQWITAISATNHIGHDYIGHKNGLGEFAERSGAGLRIWFSSAVIGQPWFDLDPQIHSIHRCHRW